MQLSLNPSWPSSDAKHLYLCICCTLYAKHFAWILHAATNRPSAFNKHVLLAKSITSCSCLCLSFTLLQQSSSCACLKVSIAAFAPLSMRLGIVPALQESNIAWSSDHTQLYGDYTPTNFNLAQYPQYRGGGTITGSVRNDEHFLVWMRPGAARTVRKLYGRMNSNIPAGKAMCTVYHASLFDRIVHLV